LSDTKSQIVYNRAAPWQIGFFALNNTATNLYLFMFMFVSYYATGIAGLLVVAVSSILTFMRVWDGVTDPIIGYFIDKTESKLGKFRPFMLLGNLIMAILAVIVFKTTHRVPAEIRLLYFVAMYALYIIGYTFQTACTKAAQTVLTNDPKQRPLFTLFDAIYNTALFIGGQTFVSTVLAPKNKGFTQGFFDELLAYFIALSAVFTVLAVISIWRKDVKENWGGIKAEKVRFRDYWPVIKRNRPLQMLIVSAATDKLAMLTKTNAVTTVILYGVLMGSYALSGKLQMISALPTIAITFLGIGYARRLGLKKAYVLATWICIVLSAVLFLFLWGIDMKSITIAPLSANAVIYLVLFSLLGGVAAVGNNIVIPMIADASDYELYHSGNYIPGMIGTIFSFVDKLISSVATTIIGGFNGQPSWEEAAAYVCTHL
jgi:Na+/melibiose symporter-like transporter